MERNCRPDGGKKLQTQLTLGHIKGKSILRKRVSKGELHISSSDKGIGIFFTPLNVSDVHSG